MLAAGLVTDPKMTLQMAGMAAPLLEAVVIYTNGGVSVTKQMAGTADGKRVSVESRKIAAIERKMVTVPTSSCMLKRAVARLKPS